MNKLVTKQLIFDYFAGQVTALQRQQIDEWSGDPAHQELFYKWLEEWEHAHLQYIADDATALDRYHTFLNQSQSTQEQITAEPEKPVSTFWRKRWFLYSLAASITLIIGFLFFHQQLLTKTYSTTYGQTLSLTLSDGSQVTLNANSSLQVPRLWNGIQSRQVELKGEAFFSVTHTATDQRFVVKTQNGPEVVVLGTEFTLFTRDRGTRVALDRGKVEVHYRQENRQSGKITLKPGDLVTVSKTGAARLQENRQTTDFAAWRNHRYVFDHTSLQELTHLFRENFGITLKITDPETAALTLSGAYPAQSGEELLQIVAEALNIQITKQNGTVLLAPMPI